MLRNALVTGSALARRRPKVGKRLAKRALSVGQTIALGDGAQDRLLDAAEAASYSATDDVRSEHAHTMKATPGVV